MSKEEIENMIWEIVREEIEEQENINDGCKGCFFDYYGLKCNRPLHYEPCIGRERSDGKQIIFVL